MTYIVSLYVICEVAFWGCVRHAIQTPSNQQYYWYNWLKTHKYLNQYYVKYINYTYICM